MPINEIQTGRFNAVLRKLLGMDVGAPSPSLATDMFPVLVMENDRPEFVFLGGGRLAEVTSTAAAGGAGTFGKGSLFNPADSGALVVMESLVLADAQAATTVRLAVSTATLLGAGGAINGVQRDRRATGGTAAKVYENVDANTPGANIFRQDYIATATEITVPGPYILAPGTGVTFALDVANIYIRYTFRWRERTLEASETR